MKSYKKNLAFLVTKTLNDVTGNFLKMFPQQFIPFHNSFYIPLFKLLENACTTVKKHTACKLFSEIMNWYIIVFVHDISCPSNGCLVHDKKVHQVFSALNLTTILSSLLLVITQPFQYSFQIKYHFSIKLFLLNTSSMTVDRTLTNWLRKSSHKWHSFSNASISYNSVVSYFNFCAISTFNRK